MTDEPPDYKQNRFNKLIPILLATLIIGILAVFFLLWYNDLGTEPPEKYAEGKETKLSQYRPFGTADIQGTALIAVSPPVHIKPVVLGSLIEKDSVLFRIIQCESGWNPKACNSEFGCSSGMGLCQFIKSTWLDTINRMGELLPEYCRSMEAVFDAECNLTACKWLYETDGDVHWREWSGHCWDK